MLAPAVGMGAKTRTCMAARTMGMGMSMGTPIPNRRSRSVHPTHPR